MKKVLYLLIVVSLVLCRCANKPEAKEQKQVAISEIVKTETAFINPPLKHIDVPYREFIVSAQKGKKITLASGSKIVFPPDAFVDSDGKIVKGDVTVLYREFKDPAAIFMAGIPMAYDSLAPTHVFESAAMFEIKALQNGSALGVNPQRKPQLSLDSRSKSPDYNTYYLDTIQKKWKLKGDAVFSDSAKQAKAVDTVYSDDEFIIDGGQPDLPVSPQKPSQASGNRPVFSVDAESYAMFPEFKIYKDTEFEVDESEKNYNPKDSETEWDKVQLAKTETRGIYQITFKTRQRIVSYRVRPVYTGKRYDEAIKAFNSEYAKYEKVRQKALAKIEVQRRVQCFFEIDNFGFWNCDRLFREQTEKLQALFADENGNPIKLSLYYLVNKQYNTVFTFYDGGISIVPDSRNTIWTVKEGKFVYCPYPEFIKAEKQQKNGTCTFRMTTYKDSITNYDQVKKLLQI
ncbi:hypothetical protein [Flavobacterium silvaticum]|uniref:Uncharacterized protein n=1 Tax=Flavobacterium silvaticum TaxID=1852020 RepID=A0A972JJ51_9FLAO|nr:hypothetical protein [Flavobacterium silvaticum]NMH27852.1 hypothetical protein [Flavobacterium silvaticum]